MQHEHLKERLETELTAVKSELSAMATEHPDTGDWVAKPEADTIGNADENVAADVNEDWATRRATLASLETRYRNLQRALEKMAAGTYGVCEVSDEPIEPERLEANPAARTNIANREREDELPL